MGKGGSPIKSNITDNESAKMKTSHGVIQGYNGVTKETFTGRMKRKIDSTVGRVIYGMRLAIAEPPFAHIKSALGLDRFTLRGKRKVNIQWNLFCMIHNLKKIHRYGAGFA